MPLFDILVICFCSPLPCCSMHISCHAGSCVQGEDDDIVIEYVSAPLEFGSAEVDDSAADDERPTMGLGLGFAKPKVGDNSIFAQVYLNT